MIKWLAAITLAFTIQATCAETTRYLPHYTFKAGQWNTEISLKNEEPTAQTLQVKAYSDTGAFLGEYSWELPPNGSLRAPLSQLAPELSDTAGWLAITTPRPLVSGFITYQNTVGKGTTSLPLIHKPAHHLAFTGMSNGQEWRSGLALSNVGNEPVTLKLQLIDEIGVVRSETSRDLAPYAKLVSMAADLFSDNLPQHFTVKVFSDQPVAGMALNFSPQVDQIVAIQGEHMEEGWPRLVESVTEVQGNWESLGYGMRWTISDNTLTQYQYHAEGCLKIFEGPLEILEGLNIFRLNEDLLEVHEFGSITPNIFRKINDLGLCGENPANPTDPQLNFEYLWNIFNDHYAFLNLYGVDWQAAYHEFRPKVTPETTDAELWEIMTQMLYPLRDAHINLSSNDKEYDGRLRPGATGDMLIEEAALAGADLYAYIGGEVEGLHETIFQNYLKDPIRNEFGGMYYGFADNDIGYINIMAMLAFFEEGMTLDQVANNLDEAMTAIFEKFAQSPAIIVDVRYNGGGADIYALMMASYFAQEDRMALYKQARMGDGLTAPISLRVSPINEEGFNKPVILLTSPYSASATEIFTYAMDTQPNVLIMGEPGAGAQSDTLGKFLPNGWTLTISNEIYYSPEGVAYEGLGIPVDVTIPTWSKADRTNKTDSVIEAAIAHIRNNP